MYTSGMRLDRAAVVDAGVDLVQETGLEALSVRAVASDLGVTPMALYRHIEDAATLHAAVIEQLLGDLPRVPTSGRWDERCRAWAVELREATSRSPGLARYLLTHWTELTPAIVMVNSLATMLHADGPRDMDVVAGSNAVFTYVLARVQGEEAIGQVERSRDLSSWDALGADAAFLLSHRAEYEVARVDEHFTYGLDALLAGLASTRRRRNRGARS